VSLLATGSTVMSQTGSTTYPVPLLNVAGPLRLTTDAAYGMIDPGIFRTRFPSTYKGIGMDPWFPGGLDMRSEPATRLRGLSGSTVKGNNFAGSLSVIAAATTGTVLFPAKAYENFTSFSLSATTGGSLALGTYKYRVASRPQQGGPIVARTEQSITTSGSSTAVLIQVNGLQQVTTYIEGFTIYRGTVAGTYTQRYDVVPNQDWFGLGSIGGERHSFIDLGTTLGINGNAQQLGYGYTDPTPITVGGPFVPADETHLEPDANYKVFLEPSWLTTWTVTAKRTNGFDVSFGTAAPGGGGTVNWMLVR
jgi:hypothetical protein